MSSRVLALVSCCLLGGCVEPTTTPTTAFSGDPLQAFTTDAGLSVKVWTDPQPPARGQVAVKFEFPQHAGHTIHAEVTPWMPAMGHGSNVVTADDALVAEGLSLYMAGTWELRTQLTGDVSDAFVVELSIP